MVRDSFKKKKKHLSGTYIRAEGELGFDLMSGASPVKRRRNQPSHPIVVLYFKGNICCAQNYNFFISI